MSLANDNRIHQATEIKLKDECSLILSEKLLLQIHNLHAVVKSNTEWSGILIYEVKEGDIDNPKDLVLFAHELVPMDVGTSGYTEYDFDPKDEYSFEKIADAMEKEYKLGHIHTHHSMKAFFSGTDTSELHDNAPNHNFYLSLIVNYENSSDWCAKVAIAVDEVTEGSVKTEGFFKKSGTIKKITKWRGHSGEKIKESEEDVNEDKDFTGEEAINSTKKFLYTISCDIELEETAKAWEDRIIDLNKPKYKSNYFQNKHSQFSLGLGFGQKVIGEKKKNGGNGTNAKIKNKNTIIDIHGHEIDLGGNNEEVDPHLVDLEEQFNNSNLTDEIFAGRKNNLFNASKVESWLCNLISLHPFEDSGLDNTIHQFEKEYKEYTDKNKGDADVYEDLWRSQADDLGELWADHDFNLGTVTPQDMFCIAHRALVSLEPYKDLQCYEIFETYFDQYIIPEDLVSDADFKRLTNLVWVEQ